MGHGQQKANILNDSCEPNRTDRAMVCEIMCLEAKKSAATMVYKEVVKVGW